MKKFIPKLNVVPTIISPVSLYCDNNGAIAQAKEPRPHQRSKHIDRNFHKIRELISNGDVCILKVASADNVAENIFYLDLSTYPLTKPMSQSQLVDIQRKWVLDTWLNSSSASGRLLEMCPKS